eukprot:CAMPEP_0175526726 /NCGR_PEP_ID=MMETSP0096-20121207/19764_1 /TAXON_ID=311494 /ORGANISM="Alexandrium monilatum, Strain CCMP3105" /LENGTH=80 /DNA_ID=CAMNT_0016829365 /DNA_START=75 /DNA_END=314 /DNA_ORIENTATION=-
MRPWRGCVLGDASRFQGCRVQLHGSSATAVTGCGVTAIVSSPGMYRTDAPVPFELSPTMGGFSVFAAAGGGLMYGCVDEW